MHAIELTPKPFPKILRIATDSTLVGQIVFELKDKSTSIINFFANLHKLDNLN